jgi:chemotaxis response regulator CheB
MHFIYKSALDPELGNTGDKGIHMTRAKNQRTDTTQSQAMQNGRCKMVVMAVSRGGIKAVGDILSMLPSDFPAPIAIVLHRTAQQPNYLPQVLGRRTELRVKVAEVGEPIHSGTVYLAPPNLHFMVHRDGTVKLSNGLSLSRHFLHSLRVPQ